MAHCDIVHNDFGRMEQRLHERIPPDHPDASIGGTYCFATDPHEMDDCPFLNTDSLPMRRVVECCTCGLVPPCLVCPEP